MKNLEPILQYAAGIDVGSENIFIATGKAEFKTFGTFTDDFHQALAFLKAEGIQQVAMEATGVYWVCLHEILEGGGIHVDLVKAGDAKHLPGRSKTDGADCQWIQKLYSHGLLRKCFIPEEQIRQLRAYMRIRQDHIQSASMHIQHMQKAFTQMNIRLHQVISDITGVSGIRIIEAILSGERNGETLAQLCDRQIIKKKQAEVIKSLQGFYKEEHLFLLKQSYDSYRHYRQQIQDCDQQIELVLQAMQGHKPSPPDKGKKKKAVKNQPAIPALRNYLLTITEGKDATVLPGISELNFLRLISEIGTDMSKWKNEKHFASWLRLAPIKHRSGHTQKNVRGSKSTKSGQIFREAAQGLLQSKYISLGAFGRRLKAIKCSPVAIKAVARKLSQLYYRLMTKGLEFIEKGIETYNQLYQQSQLRKLQKQAFKLGMHLQPLTQPMSP